MRIIGLDWKEYRINFSTSTRRESCSDLHDRARILLKSIFPLEKIYEEVELLGTKVRTNRNVIADFFIPLQKIIVEVQGEQHTNFSRFFHKDVKDFYKGKIRDNTKSQWCELNNIRLIILDYDENDDEWRRRITN